MHATLDARALDRLQTIRAAQQTWANSPLASRLHIIRRLRDGIARHARRLAAQFPPHLHRSLPDTLSSEIIPLAEACRFLERRAPTLLRPKRVSTVCRPFWLRGVHIETRREPHGIALIIGPGNYPLFLAAVQSIQALVAGNAVLLKPGRAAHPVLTYFAELAFDAGLPRDLLFVLSEDIEEVAQSIESGVDKIVLTGSATSGRAVLRQAAEHLTPAIMELSGNDPVFVLRSANLSLAARAIAFGRRLNQGNTCIAPRRLFVAAEVAEQFRHALGCDAPLEPIVFSGVEQALALAQDPHALGATIFGNESEARHFAAGLNAGIVVINDMIVPTADPRVSFGGRGASGFGKTRGEEGLLEMTTSKTVLVQRAKQLRHLDEPPPGAEHLFLSYLESVHRAHWRDRIRGWQRTFAAIRNVKENQQ